MGPQASLLLHKRLIKRASVLGAINGEDFPTIMHLSLPIPDFISNFQRLDEAVTIIRESLYRLWRHKIHSCSHCL